jgi:uncharacterized protein DUF1573
MPVRHIASRIAHGALKLYVWMGPTLRKPLKNRLKCHHKRGSSTVAKVSELVAAFFTCMILSSCEQPKPIGAAIQSSAKQADGRNSITPSKIDFGIVVCGTKVSQDIWIHNSQEREDIVNSITTTCDCLKLQLETLQLAPGARIKGQVVLDLSAEPEFSGGLLGTIKGECRHHSFELQVSVDVRKKE